MHMSYMFIVVSTALLLTFLTGLAIGFHTAKHLYLKREVKLHLNRLYGSSVTNYFRYVDTDSIKG